MRWLSYLGLSLCASCCVPDAATPLFIIIIIIITIIITSVVRRVFLIVFVSPSVRKQNCAKVTSSNLMNPGENI